MTILIVFCWIVGLLGWLGLIVFLLILAMEAQSWWYAVACLLVFALPIAIGIGQSMEDDAKPFDGYVYKKTFEPARTTFIMSGKTMVPIFVPDRWNMVLKSDSGESRSCDISHEAFEEFELGSIQHCGGY